jgi:uncharacterized protein YjiS (DUF1127 family)
MPRALANLLPHPLAALPRAQFRFTDLADLVLNWMEVARQRRHLASLDNRMLSDIGFSGADVEREIERPFWDIGPKGR